MPGETETNTLIEVIQTAISRAFEDVHTCMPGRIERYDFKTQKAQVKPLLKKVYLSGERLDLPVLGNVPVVFPRSTTAGLTFPINKNDKCLLVFSERSLERWYLSGDNIEPGDPRRYDLSDAIAIPGLYSFAEPNIQTNNNDVELHHTGQKITIKKNGDIELGAESLKSLVTDAMFSKFNSHTHVYAPGPGTPIPTGTPVTPPAVPVIMGPTETTTKVKAQ